MAVIVVDGQKLNLAKKESERSYNEQFVIDEIEKLRKRKKVRFFSTQVLTKNKIVFKPDIRIDLAGTLVNPQGVTEKWVYCTKPTIDPKTGREYFPTHVYTAKRDIVMQADQGKDVNELMFFLTKIVNLSQFGYKLEDKATEAELKREKLVLDNEVRNWVFNKFHDTEVMQMAYRYNLSGIEDKGTVELRVELYEYIAAQDKNTNNKIGFKKFLEELRDSTEKTSYASIVAHLNKAVKDRIIEYNKEGQNVRYTGTNTIITQIPPERFSHDKEEFVAEFLQHNEKERNIFFGAASGLFKAIQEMQQKEIEADKEADREKAKVFKDNPTIDNITHHTHMTYYLKNKGLFETLKFPEGMTDIEEKKAYVRKYEQDNVQVDA